MGRRARAASEVTRSRRRVVEPRDSRTNRRERARETSISERHVDECRFREVSVVATASA